MRNPTINDYQRLLAKLTAARDDTLGLGSYAAGKLRAAASGCPLRIYRRFRLWARFVGAFDTLALKDWHTVFPKGGGEVKTGARPSEGLWFAWSALCQCRRKNATNSYEAYLKVSTPTGWKPSEPHGSEGEEQPYFIALEYAVYFKELTVNEAREGLGDTRQIGPYPESPAAWVRLAKGLREVQLNGGAPIPPWERGG